MAFLEISDGWCPFCTLSASRARVRACDGYFEQKGHYPSLPDRERGAVIQSQRLTHGVLLFLPLCPSTNARMRPVRMGGRCRDILTAEARDYIRSVGFALRLWARAERFRPIASYAWLDLWFILPRRNCDAHNYGKVLFDALEAGGVVANDKYILPRVMGVWHDAKAEVVVKVPTAGSC